MDMNNNETFFSISCWLVITGEDLKILTRWQSGSPGGG